MMLNEPSGTCAQSSARQTPRWWRGILLRLLGGCVVAFAIPCLGMIAAQKAAVGPEGSTAHLWNLGFLFFPFVAFAGVLILTSPFLLLISRIRRFAILALFTALSFLAGFFYGDSVGLKARSAAFHELAERSKPLIAAIRKYESEQGTPPANLGAIVPDYLPAIPSTGMGAYPKYEYVVGDDAEAYDGNPWVLFIYTPSGGINFDRFLYFPKQNYPKEGYGGYLERIGEWAYVHE